ncbi:MAG: M42 family metallopeptidase [Candidatus Hodarchaeales archaeon]
MDLESIKKTQKELSEIIGVSGYEDRVVEYIIKRIKDKVDTYWVDSLGSLLAVKKGNSDQERIMLDAHLDEVGFMISHVEKGGFLRFVPIGGWDTRILLGQSVKVVGKEDKIFDGIIGSKPPHLTTESERKSAIEIKDLYIDLGLDGNEVKDSGITVGSVGTLYDPFVDIGNGVIRGKAFDDRTGINVLIHIIEEFQKREHSNTLLFSFSVQEEVGGRGAVTAAYKLNPTMALAIENTTAGDVPGIPESQCPTYIGRGPAISVADRSMLAHPKVNRRLVKNAELESIPYQIKKPIYGGTNAGRIHQTREGIPSSVVSVPCRYIHSPTSLLKLNDIHYTIQLVSAFIRNPAKIE